MYVCLIIAETGPRDPVLYKGDRGVSDAARPPEGGLAEAVDLSASSLPGSIDRPARTPDRPLNSQRKNPQTAQTRIHPREYYA